MKVLTDLPLRTVLHRSDTSGSMTKWTVELIEFDLSFVPWTLIKAQIFADFIAECTPSDKDQVDDLF